jgi:hypothetical protein
MKEKKLKTMQLRYVLLIGLVLNTPSASVDLNLSVSKPSLEADSLTEVLKLPLSTERTSIRRRSARRSSCGSRRKRRGSRRWSA